MGDASGDKLPLGAKVPHTKSTTVQPRLGPWQPEAQPEAQPGPATQPTQGAREMVYDHGF